MTTKTYPLFTSWTSLPHLEVGDVLKISFYQKLFEHKIQWPCQVTEVTLVGNEAFPNFYCEVAKCM